jgi:hypothetical protein
MVETNPPMELIGNYYKIKSTHGELQLCDRCDAYHHNTMFDEECQKMFAYTKDGKLIIPD